MVLDGGGPDDHFINVDPAIGSAFTLSEIDQVIAAVLDGLVADVVTSFATSIGLWGISG